MSDCLCRYGCSECLPNGMCYIMPTLPKPIPFPPSFENYVKQKNEEYMNIADYLVSAQNKCAELNKSIEAVRAFRDKPELGLQYLSNNKWMDFKYPITTELFPGTLYRNKPQPQYRPYNHFELVKLMNDGAQFIVPNNFYDKWRIMSVQLSVNGGIYLTIKCEHASKGLTSEGLLEQFQFVRSADYTKAGVEI